MRLWCSTIFGYRFRGKLNSRVLALIVMYYFQHCFICRPSESSVSEDARIEPRTVTTLRLLGVQLFFRCWIYFTCTSQFKHFVISTAAAKTTVFSFNPLNAFFLSICLCIFLSVYLSVSLSVNMFA